MSQLSTLRSLDADMALAFLSAGMADTGVYRTPDKDEVERIHYLHDTEDLVETGDGMTRASGSQAVVSLFLGEFSESGITPGVGGVVVGDDGRSWRLAQPVASDDSMVRWLVTPVLAEGA